jgi:hypothetical protein
LIPGSAGWIRRKPAFSGQPAENPEASAIRDSFEVGFEAFEEGFLAAKDFPACGGEIEPGATVGFGNFDLAAGARGPLDQAGVRDQGRGVEVAFDGPGGNLLAGRLGDDAEGGEFFVGKIQGEGRTGLLLKLAAGGFESRLAIVVFAFGDGPGVFFGPERAAGMDEEDFGARGRAAVKEDSGGGLGHGRTVLIIGVWAVDLVVRPGTLLHSGEI